MFKKKMAVAATADVPVSTVSDPGKTEQFSVWNCIKGYLYIPFAILFICVFFTKVVLLAFIPTSSMVPTLQKETFSFAIAWSPLRIWSAAISLCSTATTKTWN